MSTPQDGLFNVPVLFIVFNRLDLTKQVFSRIKQIKPKKLFIAADGPRLNNVEDKIKCEQVRQYLVANIDWSCELKTLFREENFGCAKACAGAIDWFFSQVEEGVVIEDDCLIDLSFFRFCAEMLEKYRNDKRIMQITSTYFGEPFLNKYSYYFSRIASVGAWASWRRAWNYYSLTMESLPLFLEEKQMLNIYHKKITASCWNWIFNFLYTEKHKNTWDFQWAYAIFSNNSLIINPGVNLVTNIGFTQESTHGSNADSILANNPSQSIEFPLKHPCFILPNRITDDWKNNYLIGANWHIFGAKQFLRKIGLFNFVKKIVYFFKK